jgi:hypothetical protein
LLRVPRLSLLNRALPLGGAVWSANVVSSRKSTAEPKRLSRGTQLPDGLNELFRATGGQRAASGSWATKARYNQMS